jgi:hypothetical protein
MAKSSKTSKQRESSFELLRGGELAEGVVLRRLPALKRQLSAEVNEKSAIQRQAAKYLSQIETPAGSGDSAKEGQAIHGLRQLTEQLAKQKLAAPRRVHLSPDVWGQYSLKFTPPYLGLGTSSVGQISDVTGNPTISASGVDALGQLRCSVATDFSKPSAGTASNLMGVHFKPLFSQAKARISFDSDITFSWYVNSIQNKDAFSRAQGLIQLFQFDTSFVQPSLTRGAFIGWNIVTANSLNFDFISKSGPTWFLEAPVSSSHFYFVVISLSCGAIGAGWPGSLAGASAMVTVPSITVTVTGEPLLQQVAQ